MNVFFDMDGVLADTQTEVLRRYNAEYNKSYALEDIVEWDLRKVQSPGTDMCKYFDEPGFFLGLEPMVNSQKVVEILSGMGINLFVASASPSRAVHEKALWLQMHFPVIPKENFCFITRKDVLHGDILLDDGLHNLSRDNFKYPIVFDSPWNRNGKRELVRSYNWFHFLDLVRITLRGCEYRNLQRESLRILEV